MPSIRLTGKRQIQILRSADGIEKRLVKSSSGNDLGGVWEGNNGAPAMEARAAELVEGIAVPTSVLEAIKVGVWDFEPQEAVAQEYSATAALPGTDQKLAVLAERVRLGLPLWHPSDRLQYDDDEDS